MGVPETCVRVYACVCVCVCVGPMGTLLTRLVVECCCPLLLPSCRKKINLSHFLPQSILQRVPRPKDCLEHYFHLLRDKWRSDQVMSETKCMQNYLRLFEENLQPDIHKFTVKVVSFGPIDGICTVEERWCLDESLPLALSLPIPLSLPLPQSQQSIDSSVEQDQVQVEMSAYSGIKIKRANQQVCPCVCLCVCWCRVRLWYVSSVWLSPWYGWKLM